MNKDKPAHGGRRPNSGRPSKGGRLTTTICLSPENRAYLSAMGRDKNDFLNRLLDGERKKQKE